MTDKLTYIHYWCLHYRTEGWGGPPSKQNTQSPTHTCTKPRRHTLRPTADAAVAVVAVLFGCERGVVVRVQKHDKALGMVGHNRRIREPATARRTEGERTPHRCHTHTPGTLPPCRARQATLHATAAQRGWSFRYGWTSPHPTTHFSNTRKIEQDETKGSRGTRSSQAPLFPGPPPMRHTQAKGRTEKSWGEGA